MILIGFALIFVGFPMIWLVVRNLPVTVPVTPPVTPIQHMQHIQHIHNM